MAVMMAYDRGADALDIRLLEVGTETLGASRLFEKPDAPAVGLEDVRPRMAAV